MQGDTAAASPFANAVKTTPAMPAGAPDRLWNLTNRIKLLDEQPTTPNFENAQYGPALGF
jgi:hypothetical protein